LRCNWQHTFCVDAIRIGHFKLSQMRSLLCVIAAFLSLVPAVRAQQTYTMLDQAFQAGDQAAVKVAVAVADVFVVTGLEGAMRIEIQVMAPDRETARRYYDAQQYAVALNDGTLEVLDQPTHRARTGWHRPLQTQIFLATPVSVDLRVRTADGDLAIADVRGDVFVRTSYGDIVAEHLSGVMLEARTSDGDIVVKSAEFKNVVLQTAHGDISVNHAEAEEVTAVTSDGDIVFGHLAGIADIRTSDGDIAIGTLIVSSGKIRTSDGDLSLDAIEGKLDASTAHGDIVANLVRFDAVTLMTTDGDIVVSVPSSQGADLDLSASRVHLDCCASFEGQQIRRRVEGMINGGGSSLRVSSSYGTILLQER